MSTSPVIENKYYLKNLHADIDLYDRRLAHLLKFEIFPTEAARAAAVRKLNLKRDPLVAIARRLAAEGVELKLSELPRSFRSETDPIPVATPEPTPEPAEASSTENRSARRHTPGHTAATLDWEKSIQHYMQNKPTKA